MKIKFLASIMTLMALSLIVWAQTSRGSVSGLVTDSTGAVLPGAAVTLVNTQTGVSRTTVTNGEGAYRFDAVDLGLYSITISTANFGAVTKTNIEVRANQIAQVDAQLAPKGQELTVDVTAETGAALQTEAPVRGGNLNRLMITELPFAGRNPVSLALTLPGVSTNRFAFGVGTVVVNGGRGRSNNFLIDGTENNDISVAGQGFQVMNPDAVQEVSVQTSNYDAEFGRAGGAVINTITRGGTNQYHGTASFLYDTTNDDAITNTQALSQEVQRRGHPPYGTEQFFAGTFGGPIIRDRTFFFGAYQNNRQASNRTANIVSLSAAGRATLRSLFPAGTNNNVDTYLALTNGVDATSQFFNTALSSGDNIQFGTAVTFFPQTFTAHQFLGRVDHKLGERDQLSGRYLFDDQVAPVGGATLGIPGFTTSQVNRFQNFLLSETHVFSPSLTNELRLSYNRIALGFPLDPPNQLGLTQPLITIDDITDLSGRQTNLGIQTNLPQGRIANNYVIQDTMSYLRGNHTFRFGFDLLKQRSRQFAPINERGSLIYNASSGKDSAGNPLPSFSSFANFVDDFGGSGGSANRDFGSPLYYPYLFRQAYFFQDRWRVNEALTLTLGLRYENFGNPVNSIRTAAFTGLFNVDPVTFAGPYSQPSKAADDNNNFAPIIGVAYSPSFSQGLLGWLAGERKTVIRAGYQMGYDSFFNNIASNAAASSPNVVATSTPSTVSGSDPRGLANLTNSFPLVARPLSPLDSQTLVDPNLVNPYYQRWSLGIQRELPGKLIVDASYVGSKGTKLYLNEDRNPLVPANLRITPAGFTGSTTCTPNTSGCLISGRLDNLQGERLIRSNSGSSSYHAGQLQMTQRLSNGLTLSGAYTYSKLIDNGSEIFASAGLVNSSRPIIPHVLGGERNERAVSLFDRTHRASFTYVYELPFMREQRGLLGRLAGGWQISGVTTFESGVPFTVVNGADSNGLVGNNDRPDFNPNGIPGVRAIPATATNPSPTGFINPDANNAPIDPSTAQYIGLPANIGRTGTLGRNTERTRGTNNFDFNVMKRVAITEGIKIELRTEFYNIFNHPQFGTGSVSPFSPGGAGPAATVTTSPGGSFLKAETGDGGGRVIRYQLKLIF
jgi:Carboxypeptidase regulatory-like domain/TonB-dependent Receptor Plug Domain/TonB dependent receptor